MPIYCRAYLLLGLSVGEGVVLKNTGGFVWRAGLCVCARSMHAVSDRVRMRSRVHVYVHVHVHVRVRVLMRVYAVADHMRVRMCVFEREHVYVHVYVRVHVYVHETYPSSAAGDWLRLPS